ncbi:MAG: 4-hydroxythreonine-4-phosphate dehydrogenase PdxA [Halothiobacillaceae bacterium]
MRLAITPGEPAGIGIDLACAFEPDEFPVELVFAGDERLLADRAARLGRPARWSPYDPATAPVPGALRVLDIPLARPARPGHVDPANAAYVLDCLRRAADGCLSGEFAAMVTGPVHKGVINEAGIPFTGHTEFLAERTGGRPIMLLTAGNLRVALATTHLPLRAVADAITAESLEYILRQLHDELGRRLNIPRPRILVAGLNPHAGEGGHLGDEEVRMIGPLLERLRADGLDVHGPLPADTLFTPRHLERTDAVLAMYHDQGLPVLKHVGFGRAVNVTLGLPIIRTSVDHGTALDLAGTAKADPGSFREAVRTAIRFAGGPCA